MENFLPGFFGHPSQTLVPSSTGLIGQRTLEFHLIEVFHIIYMNYIRTMVRGEPSENEFCVPVKRCRLYLVLYLAKLTLMPRDLFVLTHALSSDFKDLLLFRESFRLCRPTM